MNPSEARAFIIDQLGKEVDRNTILLDLCRQLNIDWKHAEQLMQDVEAFDGQEIARRQSPLLIILGLGVVIGGLALTTYGIWYFWSWSQWEATMQLASAQYIYVTAGTTITGLAMIVGGIVGFRKVFSALLN